MTTPTVYVADTNALISAFPDFFINDTNQISEGGISIIRSAIFDYSSPYRVSFPCVIFIELRRLFLHDAEITSKFFFEIFTPILNSDFAEIREIDKEILINTLKLDGALEKHELHDKIVVSSAIALNCPVITSDTAMHQFALDNPTKLSVIK